MTDKIVLTNKEIHNLFRFCELKGKANVVLDIEKTPIGNIYRVATQSSIKKALRQHDLVEWKDITDYERW